MQTSQMNETRPQAQNPVEALEIVQSYLVAHALVPGLDSLRHVLAWFEQPDPSVNPLKKYSLLQSAEIADEVDADLRTALQALRHHLVELDDQHRLHSLPELLRVHAIAAFDAGDYETSITLEERSDYYSQSQLSERFWTSKLRNQYLPLRDTSSKMRRNDRDVVPLYLKTKVHTLEADPTVATELAKENAHRAALDIKRRRRAASKSQVVEQEITFRFSIPKFSAQVLDRWNSLSPKYLKVTKDQSSDADVSRLIAAWSALDEAMCLHNGKPCNLYLFLLDLKLDWEAQRYVKEALRARLRETMKATYPDWQDVFVENPDEVVCRRLVELDRIASSS